MMDIQYYGGNCVSFSNKKVKIVIDDDAKKTGVTVAGAEDIVLFSSQQAEAPTGVRFYVDGPGEYEISEVSIKGIPAQAHIDSAGHNTTIYSLHMGSFSVAVIGNVAPELSDEQLEALGIVDVLVIPVGGNGYTLDSVAATKLVRKIEPKLVIPTHYAESGVEYEVPQADLDLFLHEMGATDTSPQDVLKLKEADLTDKTQVVVLSRSKK
jgi:L-ascorbate metabolism protein UlaG (beta-lactamase superfamily)